MNYRLYKDIKNYPVSDGYHKDPESTFRFKIGDGARRAGNA